jgi:hypothetical protein
MKFKAFFTFCCGLLSVPLSHATHLDALVIGGAVMPRLTNTSPIWIYSDPGLMNNYITLKKTSTGGMWGLGIGAGSTTLTPYPIDATLSLTGYSVDFRHVSGVKQPFVNQGSFDTSLYSFANKSAIGLVEGRLFYTSPSWQPFILAGIGVSHNTASNYLEAPMGAAVANQNFFNASHDDFAFEAGFGLKHTLFQDQTGLLFALSLDYRYLNAGASHLGPFDGQTTADRLGVTHLQTDALLLTLSATA